MRTPAAQHVVSAQTCAGKDCLKLVGVNIWKATKKPVAPLTAKVTSHAVVNPASVGVAVRITNHSNAPATPSVTLNVSYPSRCIHRL